MNNSYEKAKEITEKYEQQHLLRFYDELDEEDKVKLIDQILSINFGQIDDLYSSLVKAPEMKLDGEITPMEPFDIEECTEEEKEDIYNIGLNAIKKGEAAVFLLAGGQGSRLGHMGPKGTFNLGEPFNKSLFEIQVERLKAISKKSKVIVPLYIMTSPENHKDTIEFFKVHNYFSYGVENINFFKQGVLPMVDGKGKIYLKDKGSIYLGPDGSGGCFNALKKSGMLEHMKFKGAKWIIIHSVDNVLINAVDPYFIGYTIKSSLEAGGKVVSKNNPFEKIGILCYKEGNPYILEYSELPEEVATEKDDKGRLKYDNGVILNYILNLEVLEKNLEFNMPYHVAFKKISYVDEQGEEVKPESPNGYKFETFIFDIFQTISNMGAYKVKREDEFAPVKNAVGVDSVETAKEMLLRFLEKPNII